MKQLAWQRTILFLILLSPILVPGVLSVPRRPTHRIPAQSRPSEMVPCRRHPGRNYIDLNGSWNFRLPGESVWSEVSVPHTYNELPGLETYAGPVEYEKDFYVETLAGHSFLNFLGVRNNVRVSVNGEEVGSHETGYTSFSFEITPWLKEGRNVVSAMVDNSLDDDHPPNLIGWKNYGGITREVFIERTARSFVDGVVVASKLQLSERPRYADVTVNAAIRGNRADTVEARLFSPAGDLIASQSKGPIEKDNEVGCEFRVRDPVLWDVGQGNLYRIELVAGSNGEKDHVEHCFGIRDIRVEGTEILLNGHPLYIKGTSRHEDFPHTGCVETPEQIRGDLGLIRKAGFNAVRLAHYPYHPAFIEMCDRVGMLAVEELPVWNTSAKIMSRPAFLENSLKMATEMVRRDINHPSIIAWGIGNEVEADAPQGRGFLRKVKEHVLRLDPGRPVYTTFRKRSDASAGDIPDFLALNVKLGWYHGKATDLEPLLEDWHRAFPGKPIVLTEHSGGALAGYRSDAFTKWSEDYQAYLLHYYHKILRSKPYVAGDFVWPFFDYRDPGKSVSPIPFFNIKGIMTFDRRPKISYALMKRLNAGERPETDYVELYGRRAELLTSGRFFEAKILTTIAALVALVAIALGRQSVTRLFSLVVFFSATGVLLRDFTLDNALNPAMFTGGVSEWISLTLRPVPVIPVTLLYAAMIPLSASLLALSHRSGRSPAALLAGIADSLWPAVAMPFAFFCEPFYWACVVACVVVLFRNLRTASGQSYAFVIAALITPVVALSAILILLLQWRYEFLTYLFGYVFHGM